MKSLIEYVEKAKQTAEYMQWDKRLSNVSINNRIANLAVSYYAQDNCKVYSEITCQDRAFHYGVNIGSSVCVGVRIKSNEKARLIKQARKILRGSK